MGVAPADRFWRKVDKNGPVPVTRPDLGPCWLWTAATGKRDGYGRFAVEHRVIVPAHRFAYESTGGRIPEGLDLDHLCRIKSCVNPAHLEPVTPRENVQRANPMAHGQSGYARGCRCEVCRSGHRDRIARQRASRAERIEAAGAPHGTDTTYTNWGCRCDACRDAHRLVRATS